MKLITEQIEPVEILTEEKDGQKSTYIKGVFLQTEITNRNGRMYKFDAMNREVQKYNEEFVKRGRALGELGHPDGPTINLDRVSHKIVSLTPEGTNFMGKAKLLETPMGKIAKNLLEEGVQLGVSSRGLGSIKREGTTQSSLTILYSLQQQTLLLILPHLMLLLKVYTKGKSGV